MDKNSLIHILRQNSATLQQQYHVAQLALFGSYARDEAKNTSDIDLIVSFTEPPSARQFFALQFFLEELLKHPIDLITNKGLRPELRPYIEKDLEPIL